MKHTYYVRQSYLFCLYRNYMYDFQKYLAGRNVLEAGPNKGMLFEKYYPLTKKYTLLGPNQHFEKNYIKLQQRHPNLHYEIATFEAFEPAERFDTIVMMAVIAHIRPKPDEIFAKINDMLNPQGFLVIETNNFNNYLFAQNGNSTYPIGGLGANAQVNVTTTVQLAGGFQNATDMTGAKLTIKGFGKQNLTWFGYMQWTPKFHGLGAAQYSFTYYDVPVVAEQPSSSTGCSFSAAQNLNNTWAVFGRANGAWGSQTPIAASYAIGGAMNNPLGRSKMDQIGLAIGYAVAAEPPTNPPGTGDEISVETYWNWEFFGGLLLTPDLQYISNPARDTERDSA